MILCSCTQLTSAVLDEMIAALLEKDPHAIITPGRVFHLAGHSIVCGCCVRLIVERIGDDLRTQAQVQPRRE